MQKVLNDVNENVESKASTVLVALEISAAFDSICHLKLIERLPDEFEVNSVALSWIESYISGRSQFVKIGSHFSAVSPRLGVSQGHFWARFSFLSTYHQWETSFEQPA